MKKWGAEFCETWKSGSDFPRTLEEVGTIFNVTRERVLRIETTAWDKLRHPGRRKILIEFNGIRLSLTKTNWSKS